MVFSLSSPCTYHASIMLYIDSAVLTEREKKRERASELGYSVNGAGYVGRSFSKYWKPVVIVLLFWPVFL